MGHIKLYGNFLDPRRCFGQHEREKTNTLNYCFQGLVTDIDWVTGQRHKIWRPWPDWTDQSQVFLRHMHIFIRCNTTPDRSLPDWLWDPPELWTCFFTGFVATRHRSIDRSSLQGLKISIWIWRGCEIEGKCFFMRLFWRCSSCVLWIR